MCKNLPKKGLLADLHFRPVTLRKRALYTIYYPVKNEFERSPVSWDSSHRACPRCCSNREKSTAESLARLGAPLQSLPSVQENKCDWKCDIFQVRLFVWQEEPWPLRSNLISFWRFYYCQVRISHLTKLTSGMLGLREFWNFCTV